MPDQPSRRGIHLEYRFAPDEQSRQRGAELANPLIDLLRTLRDTGSISAAARAMGSSYRHTWGALKQWEDTLGAPLVVWVKGQNARLTPLAERLLWAETRARTRLAPHIEALRNELERVLALAFDAQHEVITLYASHDLALPLLRQAARVLAQSSLKPFTCRKPSRNANAPSAHSSSELSHVLKFTSTWRASTLCSLASRTISAGA